MITELVQSLGIKKWTHIANKLYEETGSVLRTGKQCRERWQNHLDPTVKKEPISAEEERIIFECHRRLGNKWAEIS